MKPWRRRIVIGAAAAGVLLAAAAARAQQPAQRVKGARVWLDLDQAELDDAYDQSVYAPNQKQVTGRYVTNSEAVRARLGAGQGAHLAGDPYGLLGRAVLEQMKLV